MWKGENAKLQFINFHFEIDRSINNFSIIMTNFSLFLIQLIRFRKHNDCGYKSLFFSHSFSCILTNWSDDKSTWISRHFSRFEFSSEQGRNVKSKNEINNIQSIKNGKTQDISKKSCNCWKCVHPFDIQHFRKKYWYFNSNIIIIVF